MHPLVRGAAAVAVLSALGSLAPPAPGQGASSGRSATGSDDGRCPARTLPEAGACLPLPAPGASAGAAEPPSAPPPSRARPGGELVARRPERPSDFGAYALPFAAGRPVRVLTGLEADRRLAAGAVEVAAERGEKVVAVALEGQQGPIEVAFVGELDGVTVVTSHACPTPGRSTRYLLVHGRLARPGPGVVTGARLSAGDVLGFAAEGGAPRLLLRALELREGALPEVEAERLRRGGAAVAVDLRNVLALAPAP